MSDLVDGCVGEGVSEWVGEWVKGWGGWRWMVGKVKE